VSQLQALRATARNRYLACLFLPRETREAIATLHNFDMEITAIQERISEPMPGEIRIQWWRDVMAGGRVLEARANPLAASLMDVISRFELPVETFDAYLQARIFDLYHDPMPDWPVFEAYAGETRSALLRWSALVCGAEQGRQLADVCGHGGVAVALTQVLANAGLMRNRAKLFLPISLLADMGLTRDEWFEAPPDERHSMALRRSKDLVKSHVAKANGALSILGKRERSALLPVTLARRLAEQLPSNPKFWLGQVHNLSPLRAQFTLFRASIRGIL